MFIGFSLVTDDLTFNKSNEVATSPATNLGTMQPTEACQTTNTTSIFVQCDLGTSRAVKAAGLLYATADSGTTIQYRADNTDPPSTPAYDTGVVSHQMTGATDAWDRFHFVDWDASGHSLRFHRFDIAGTHPNAFYRAGRMLLTGTGAARPGFEPTRGAQFGEIEQGWMEEEFTLEGYGPRYPREFPRAQYLEFSIHSNSKAEVYESAYNLDQRRGRSKDVFVWLEPTETSFPFHNMIYGTMTELGGIEHEYSTATGDAGFWRKRWRVEELL
jgi:hypothetical protein